MGLNTARLQAFLSYLLLHRDAPQSRAYLAYLFWPDTSEAQARTNLRNLLHHLRQSLPEAKNYIESNVQTIQWKPDALFSLDVAQFETALAQAGQISASQHPHAARVALERAVALYKGDLLPSCYEEWILPQRERLRHAYLAALEQLTRLLEEQRDYPGAIDQAQRMLREDPLQETVYRDLIRLHALNGDRAGALRVYHACTTILQRELEVEPGFATRQAYRQVLGVTEKIAVTKATRSAFSPLVGRALEWAQMLRAWHSVLDIGEPRLLIVRGEAGIGKTRLVEELMQWAARQGIPSASARCYSAEGDLAYAPIAAWLRAQPLAAVEDVWLAELARLIPEILSRRPDLPKPVALTEAWQRQRLFEALSRAILGMGQPLLLAIDDLQWSEHDILEWLHFLLRFDPSARILVVGTYRTEEVGESHPLEVLLRVLRTTEQLYEIDLSPLSETDTCALGTLVAGADLSTEAAHFLYHETEGNPLFVVETVRAGLPSDAQLPGLYVDMPGVSAVRGLPPKVLSVIESRLAQLSPPTRKLASLAATIGREFNFNLLAKASGENEELLVQELDELWQKRIIREHGAEGYDFSHDKLREAAYSNLSLAQRRILHRRVAHGLETIYAAQLEIVSHQLAGHYEQASLPRQAIPYYLMAARVARQVYANSEAISLLLHGLELSEMMDLAADKMLAGVVVQSQEELGDIYELIAQHDDALKAYKSACSMLDAQNRIGRARINCKMGIALREQRRYQEALEACRQAEITLGKQPQAHDSAWWDQWLEVQIEKVWAYYWLARWPEMEELVSKIQPDLQARGSPTGRMRYLMGSCLLHLRKERYVVSDVMISSTHEALTLSYHWGSLKNQLECQFEVGFLYLWRRELQEAEKHLLQALQLAETSGIAPMLTLTLTYLTVLARFNRQVKDVLFYMQRAQKAALSAHMPDYVAAAKGNRSWLAWQEGDFSRAERECQEALGIWKKSPLVYPFQWQAIWPLMGAAMARGDDGSVWACIAALLEPTQQLLPGGIHSGLEAALQAKALGDTTNATQRLEQAMLLAKQMGYL